MRKASEGSSSPLLPVPPSLKDFAQAHGRGVVPALSLHMGPRLSLPGSSLPALSPYSGRPSLAGSLGFPSAPSGWCSLDFFLGSEHPPSLLILAETVAVTDLCSLSCALAFSGLCSSVKLQTFWPPSVTGNVELPRMGGLLSLILFSILSICHHPSALTLTQARNWVAKQSTPVAFTVGDTIYRTGPACLHVLLSSLADRPESPSPVCPTAPRSCFSCT